MRISGRWAPALLACSLLAPMEPACRAGQLDDGSFQPVINELDGQTLFAFDTVSIPFTRSLKIEMHPPEKYSGNPVLARGEPGEPDHESVRFYGSLIRENGKFRMWYVGGGNRDYPGVPPVERSLWRPLYAESTDGVHWVKPKLGLVKYRGDKENNVLKFDRVISSINVKVLHEPDDPDPERRYKMVAHAYWMKGDKRHGSLAPYASADGLNWKLLIDAKPSNAQLKEEDIILPPVHFEPAGGLYKWDGVYYASGQNTVPATRPFRSRIARVYRSRDFVHWEPTSAVSFVRTSQYLDEPEKSGVDGEQTHEGISVWNRGNVLIGMYGLWDGGKKWTDLIINQGFVISNDGIRFREPAHEFVFIPVGPDGTWDEGGLMQGQGWENVGSKTYIYYSSGDLRTWTAGRLPSPPRGSIGLATLPRDRFGDLSVLDTGEGQPEFVTKLLKGKQNQRLFLNADGLGPEARLKIELLTHDEKPLPGFGGTEAAVVTQGGFQVPVTWKGGDTIVGLPENFRIRATFQGAEKEKIRFSAFYLQDAKS